MSIALPPSEFAYFCLMLVALTFLLKQIWVKQKRLVHVLFAIFCASLCMMTLQKITAPSLGVYQYVIGFAACATCNVVWLIARALFRKENAIQKRHVLVALLIALLIIANQAWHLLNELSTITWVSATVMMQIKEGLRETSSLLSSAILVLSFWEALRGYSSKTQAEKWQSTIFASAFFAAVFTSTFVAKVFIAPLAQANAFPWIVLFSASLIIVTIDIVLYMQKREYLRLSKAKTEEASLMATVHKQHTPIQSLAVATSGDDKKLINGIKKLMRDDKIYLQSNIKLLDFAKAVNAPEYKVSRLIRSHFESPNFNHFINRYRVDHAKQLLRSSETKEWSILVIGLESGFASLVSFNRAFKHLSGDKPSRYRTQVEN